MISIRKKVNYVAWVITLKKREKILQKGLQKKAIETDRTAKEMFLVNDPSLKRRSELQSAQRKEKLNFWLLRNQKMAYIIHTKFVQNKNHPNNKKTSNKWTLTLRETFSVNAYLLIVITYRVRRRVRPPKQFCPMFSILLFWRWLKLTDT